MFELIDERRAEDGDGDDILSLLLSARYEDDSPMSPEELRDELMTLLVAGHETTASQLAWAFERLTHEPRVLDRLAAEVAAGNGDEYITATIQETLRRRPVLLNVAPRLVKQPVEIGGWSYPAGVSLVANAYRCTTTRRSTTNPYACGPSASSTSRRAPTRGSPSAATAPLPGGQLRPAGDEDRDAGGVRARRAAGRGGWP